MMSTWCSLCFDPLDSEEIEHCLRRLDGQPEVAGIPADTIRAALASVGPATILAPSRRAQAIVNVLAFS